MFVVDFQRLFSIRRKEHSIAETLKDLSRQLPQQLLIFREQDRLASPFQLRLHATSLHLNGLFLNWKVDDEGRSGAHFASDFDDPFVLVDDPVGCFGPL